MPPKLPFSISTLSVGYLTVLGLLLAGVGHTACTHIRLEYETHLKDAYTESNLQYEHLSSRTHDIGASLVSESREINKDHVASRVISCCSDLIELNANGSIAQQLSFGTRPVPEAPTKQL